MTKRQDVNHSAAVAIAAPTTLNGPVPTDVVDSRSPVGLDRLPTVVAVGPFDDMDAQRLVAAFVTVQQRCRTQLVVLGAGAQRTAAGLRACRRSAGDIVHLVPEASDERWRELVAAGDLVVLSKSSETAALVDVLELGRPVVAPADPETVELVVPAIAGLVYPPGNVPAMAAALLRLLTTPVLRRGMGGRAVNLARRTRLESIAPTHYPCGS